MMASLQRVNETTAESRVIGGSESIAGEIEDDQEQFGSRYFVPQTSWMTIDKSRSSMRRFAEKAGPHFTESSSPAIVGANHGAELARAPTGF
jgi:hypothetical protein